jgi:hypothetical protein
MPFPVAHLNHLVELAKAEDDIARSDGPRIVLRSAIYDHLEAMYGPLSPRVIRQSEGSPISPRDGDLFVLRPPSDQALLIGWGIIQPDWHTCLVRTDVASYLA